MRANEFVTDLISFLQPVPVAKWYSHTTSDGAPRGEPDAPNSVQLPRVQGNTFKLGFFAASEETYKLMWYSGFGHRELKTVWWMFL